MSTKLKDRIHNVNSMVNTLRNDSARYLNSCMMHAIKNEYTFDGEEDEGEYDCFVDLRKLNGEDCSFHAGNDDSNDLIIGLAWNKEAGIAVIVTEDDGGETTSYHPCDEIFNLHDMNELLDLTEVWLGEEWVKAQTSEE